MTPPYEDTTSRSTRKADVLSSGTRSFLFYGLPTLAIFITGHFEEHRLLSIVWPAAFLIMAVACLANARRCGRVHCFLTGPLFLLASLLSVLHGFNVIDLGVRCWELLRNWTFGLALVLYVVPEMVWGKYFRSGG